MSWVTNVKFMVTGAICPRCGKGIKVNEDGLFVEHRDRNRKPCLGSKEPYPKIKSQE